MIDHAKLFGWIDDPARHAIAAEFPRLKDTPLGLYGAVEPSGPIALYEAWKQVLGSYPSYPRQQIGDCVSFGHGHGNDLLQCIEIAMGEPSEYRETDTEFIYAESRKISGNLGPFDGSYGSAAVKAMTTVGVVSREMLGAEGAYSGSRAKSWGRTGPPASVETLAGPYKLGKAALVQTVEEAITALWWGYPVTVCSNQGFTELRDAQGFCSPRGSWGHCMLIAGYRPDRPGCLICQSWGDVGHPSGPLALDQPVFSFWAESAVVGRMLAAGDSFALARSPEFARRPVPKEFRDV